MSGFRGQSGRARRLFLFRVVAWGLLALAVVLQGDPRRGRDGALASEAPVMPIEAVVIFLGLWVTYVVVLEGVVRRSWTLWLMQARRPDDSAVGPCGGDVTDRPAGSNHL